MWFDHMCGAPAHAQLVLDLLVVGDNSQAVSHCGEDPL